MSTKTMKQRIAVVAVSALTAGLFSVVSTPVANAAAGDLVQESLFLSTTNSATGAPVITDLGGASDLDKSVGLLALTSAAAANVQVVQNNGSHLLNGSTGTAVATNTAKIALGVASASKPAVSVTGGTITAVGSELGGTVAVIGSNATTLAGSATVKEVAFVVTPNAGATSVTVSAWQGANVTAALPSNGTAIGTWVITLAATVATGDFSPSLSAVAVRTAAGDTAITTSVDASTSGILAGNPLFIQVVGKNAYGQALTAGTYVATATNGATINWANAAAATAAGTLSVATRTPTGSDQIRIDPSQSVNTSTTTVTITHNGLPVTTKTLTFYGEVKTIKIESVKSGRTGTTVANADDTGTAYAVYSYRDSAGDKVPGGAAVFSALSATSIVTTGLSVRAPSRSTQAAIASDRFATAQETAIGTGTDGVMVFSCGSTSATTTVTIATVNTVSLATITAPVTIACNGSFATYTVSTDKASYAVGEIATITIDAKDSTGNAVSDNTVLAAGSVSVGGGSLTATIAGTEQFAAGKRTLQAQMTTAGKFNTVVTLAGSVNTTATTGYAVTDGGVSNAQVLQSIVALIASINKQIQALQKLILKR
jgi:nuclear pore complex protein Nup62